MYSRQFKNTYSDFKQRVKTNKKRYMLNDFTNRQEYLKQIAK